MFVQVLYNPKAGNKKKSQRFMERLTFGLARNGENVNVYPSQSKGDLTKLFETFDSDGCKGIFVLGGDGTLNEVVNGMMRNNVNVPVFVAPIGTANDFAYYMGITADAEKCVEIFERGNLSGIDVGLANDTYFINVCGAGLFTNSTMEFDPRKKEKWGKLAYYVKGLTMISLLNKRYPLKITKDDGEEIIRDCYFFLALNGVSTGGLKKIACDASANDGKFDFVAVKSMNITRLVPTFIKILLGRHLSNKNILYFRSNHVRVESVNNDWVFGHSDLDGQHGPDLPLDIKILPNAMEFFVK